MKTYSDTTYAILGILTTDCRTGYDIKQLIDRSLTHFWKISYGQIYPTLKTIVEEELATVTITSQPSKPERKEYHLTAKGKETLKNWLEEPIKQIPAERNEMLLKLFFGRHQSKENTVRVLKDYKTNLEARYLTYTSIEESITAHKDHAEDAVYWLFTLDYGKRMTKAAIEWCMFTLEQLVKEEE
ncbi:PadR family transcriptional regulator [Metabacillus sp. SLBN-84]